MGTNSIRSNLSKYDIISEIKLYLGADIRKENIYLLVEGSDDLKFWRSIANERVVILESFSGKTGIKEIIENHFNDNTQIIGVRDRDYESGIIHPQIFYYDYSCMEIMFIQNDETFNSIYCEFYCGELSLHELRNTILSQLKYLSLIRKYNEIYGWGIKIDGISIFNMFDKQTKQIQPNKIIDKLNEINKNYFENNPDKLACIDNAYNVYLSTEEYLYMTQGHDYISLFAAFCAKAKGQVASDKNIASSLRCSYRKSDFSTTFLYSQITVYENKYSFKIVS